MKRAALLAPLGLALLTTVGFPRSAAASPPIAPGEVVIARKDRAEISRADLSTGAISPLTIGGFINTFENAMCFDNSGLLWVTQAKLPVPELSYIYQVDPTDGSQVWQHFFGAPYGGITFEASGRWLFTIPQPDATHDGAVELVDPVAGWLMGIAGGVKPGPLAIEADGGLLIAYPDHVNRLKPVAYDPANVAGVPVSLSGGPLVDAKGMVVGADGAIWVADRAGKQIIKINPTSGAQTRWAFGGSLVNPASLAWAGDGGLLVADDGRAGLVKVDTNNPDPNTNQTVLFGATWPVAGAIATRPSTFTFSAASLSGAEGATVTVSITRSGDLSAPACVGYATSGGTATPGSDYVPASGKIVFAPGQATDSFPVQLLADGTADPAETIGLQLTGATGPAALSTQNAAAVTIQDAGGVDNTAPVISGVPANITVTATGPSGAVVNYTAPTAVDNVDGPVPVTCSVPSGSTFPVGTTVVICSATDAAGNMAWTYFTVTVNPSADTTPPVISGVPADITVDATSASGAVVTFASPTASDNVDGPVPVSCSPASGSTFPIGTTTVTCTATDAAGNTSTATFTVTVNPSAVDTTPPVISGVPADITVDAAGASGAVVTFSSPTATDDVDGALAVSCSPASGSTFPIGTTAVTCTATDAAGNTSTATFNVTVVVPPPTFANVPGNLAATATSVNGAVVNFTPPTATSVVDGALTVTCSLPPGAQFPLGTTTVVCTATDSYGNTITTSFDVTVTYAWSGFLSPAAGSSFKVGNNVVVSFQLTGASAPIRNANAVLLVDGVSQGTFAYNRGAGEYRFTWKTKGLAKGTHTLEVDLGDGVVRTMTVTLR
jgi:sugar lactone lactonase YvrE